MEDFQQNYIRKHLSLLVALTRFNTSLQTQLFQDKVLSDEDVQEINAEATEKAKASKLFKITVTKTNSYWTLVTALQDTNQTGAVDILERIDKLPVNKSSINQNRRSSESGQGNDIEKNFTNGGTRPERIYFDVKPPHCLSTGRVDELTELHKKITRATGSQTFVFQITSVSGLGGIGKTELSKMYIEKYKENFTHIIWINAEREYTMHECFVRLAKDRLGIPTKDANGGDKDIKTIVDKVYKYFSDRSGTCLIVFDNAENNKTLQTFLPLRSIFPADNIPFVHITSRQQDWPIFIEKLRLNQMKIEDAVKIVTKGLPKDSSEKEDIKMLVERLQWFPLAIQQAVAYIYKKQERNAFYNVSSYLEEYAANKIKLLKSKTFMNIPYSYTTTTFATWTVTVEAIADDEEYGKLSINILHCLAYLAAEKIHANMFLPLTNGNLDEVLDAIQLLTNYSMVSEDFNNDKIFGIHRLVQEVIQLQLQENGREQEILIVCLESLDLFPSEILEDFTEHAISIWNHAGKYPSIIKMHKSFPGQIMDCLTDQGKYRACHEFAVGAKKALESVLEKSDPEFYNLEKKTATLYFREGKYSIAIEAYTRLIAEVRSNPLYSEDKCLKLDHQIGRIFRRQGEYQKSLDHVWKVIQRRKALIGTDEEYYYCLSNQVSALIFIGDYQLASEYSKIVLKNFKELCGEDSVEVLVLLVDIGWLHGEKGDFSESVRILSDVYTKMSNLLGLEHRLTLRCGHNLAVYSTRMGNYEEGYKLFKQIYKSRKKVEGKKHPRTMLTLDSMAECLNYMGEFEKAFYKLLKVHRVYSTLYKDDNSKTLLCLAQVAIALFGRGRTEDALHTLTEVLEKLHVALGEEHVEVCKVKVKMAEMLEVKEDYKGALKLLTEVLVVQERKGTEETKHPVFYEAKKVANRINSVVETQNCICS